MILDDLFEGKIYPAENVVSSEKEFRDAIQEMERLMKYMEQKLNKEEYEAFEKYNGCMLDIQNLQCRAFFKHGYSLGLQKSKIFESQKTGRLASSIRAKQIGSTSEDGRKSA